MNEISKTGAELAQSRREAAEAIGTSVAVMFEVLNTFGKVFTVTMVEGWLVAVLTIDPTAEEIKGATTYFMAHCQNMPTPSDMIALISEWRISARERAIRAEEVAWREEWRKHREQQISEGLYSDYKEDRPTNDELRRIKEDGIEF